MCNERNTRNISTYEPLFLTLRCDTCKEATNRPPQHKLFVTFFKQATRFGRKGPPSSANNENTRENYLYVRRKIVLKKRSHSFTIVV